MKKLLIVLGIVLVLVVLLVVFAVSTYNGLVGKEETVNSSFAQIDTLLQRRADLIPNLVNTVKGYMAHEESIIEKVTEARAKLVGASTIEEKSEANEALTKAIDALVVVVENYPDLKASENFIQLQDELAGTENRIATARRDYNEAVKVFNSSIKTFPTNIFAGMFGFSEHSYFQATEAAAEVPSVEF